jgi:hypothetical protein
MHRAGPKKFARCNLPSDTEAEPERSNNNSNENTQNSQQAHHAYSLNSESARCNTHSTSPGAHWASARQLLGVTQAGPLPYTLVFMYVLSASHGSSSPRQFAMPLY